LGLEEVPHEALRIFFDEILAAPSTEELVLGIYGKAIPILRAAMQKHIEDTNPLVDQPSVRLCRFALVELDQMLEFGAQAIASLIGGTPGKPWGYYRDMTRQLWDEARHAMMGEVGFAHLGIDWGKQVMVNFTWSLALNTQLKPIERHAVLYFIEQGLMPKNGKRFEWEVGQASGDRLSALFQDYDWADEVLHAKIGRDWYLNEF